jgi:hypothetical protein
MHSYNRPVVERLGFSLVIPFQLLRVITASSFSLLAWVQGVTRALVGRRHGVTTHSARFTKKQPGGRTPTPCTFNNLNKAVESYIGVREGKILVREIGQQNQVQLTDAQLEYDGSAI